MLGHNATHLGTPDSTLGRGLRHVLLPVEERAFLPYRL
jgi:hypothetical protein